MVGDVAYQGTMGRKLGLGVVLSTASFCKGVWSRWYKNVWTRKHIPGVGTNHQSQGTREHLPGVGPNRRGLESIFQGSDPIAGD
eukprot:1188056-Prorocentrum_minimum.AAC.3